MPEPRGEYDGALRELILAYKERGRRDLARPARCTRWPRVVRRRLARTPVPVVLVPVPATAAAMRARHGDHMLRLARARGPDLRAGGRPAGGGDRRCGR